MGMTKDNDWHLDKRVSIFTILALTLQLLVLVVGGATTISKLQSGIDANAAAIAVNAAGVSENKVDIDNIQNAANLQAVQLGRIEENLIGLRRSVEALVRTIEQERNSR